MSDFENVVTMWGEKFEDALPKEDDRPDNGGNGGGSGMEERIARLEAHVEHIQSDMGDVKGQLVSMDGRLRGVENNLATLTERVAHLPSKGFIVSVVVAGLGLIITAIGFTEKIQTLFGQIP